jgi:hypothetical protein
MLRDRRTPNIPPNVAQEVPLRHSSAYMNMPLALVLQFKKASKLLVRERGYENLSCQCLHEASNHGIAPRLHQFDTCVFSVKSGLTDDQVVEKTRLFMDTEEAKRSGRGRGPAFRKALGSFLYS